jgi:hypothetical protein
MLYKVIEAPLMITQRTKITHGGTAVSQLTVSNGFRDVE